VRFVAVGDAFVDVIADVFPEQGERRHGQIALRAGGSSVNAALTAAGLGADAAVVARVGTDPAGDLVVATVQRHGVSAHIARDPDLSTGVAVALTGAVVADRGANARLSRDDVPDPLEGDALLVSGFALFQEGSREAARVALERFRGEWTAVDLASPQLATLDFDARVVFATQSEARAVPGLHDRFEIVCLKDDYGVERTAPFGAGDAFAAAFLVELANGAAPSDALTSARAAGARAASA
jgi:sugar/nucleoside kinase (ribokinase family)